MYSDSDEKTKAPSDNSTFSENTLSGLCHMLSRQRLELGTDRMQETVSRIDYVGIP